MSLTLQERDNLQQTLEQLQIALEKSQDHHNTYADLQHQLKMLESQVCCTGVDEIPGVVDAPDFPGHLKVAL